jgi:hypothetical protein
MMFLRLLCCKGEECILRHTVGAIYTTKRPTKPPVKIRPLTRPYSPKMWKLPNLGTREAWNLSVRALHDEAPHDAWLCGDEILAAVQALSNSPAPYRWSNTIHHTSWAPNPSLKT